MAATRSGYPHRSFSALSCTLLALLPFVCTVTFLYYKAALLWGGDKVPMLVDLVSKNDKALANVWLFNLSDLPPGAGNRDTRRVL
ncbi:hypothetical protein CONLIGDRAFT_450809 [Coniochaeta ligniaria NRRL 30616]|uniref:Uncharacterized protein n=1 Tax=Coniochaeta ligniaria NRRL 30616 TaxID=1408157 RepID=A0A1J7J3D2_9PEZI|nr:hypothetical protein CONLIGDRAFT_450809 [Coniochaeta ligniaria NRRL 30616]